MGGERHSLEESGVNRSDPDGDLGAPLDSGADGGPMDDAVQPEEDAPSAPNRPPS